MNRKRKLTGLVLVWAMVFLAFGHLLQAQEVPHHGSLVDMDDPKECLTCHDGAVAGNVVPCPKTGCALNSKFSHSVFRKYPPAGKESDFHPSFRVRAAGITLKNDQVTCISCHDLANQDEYHLVMANSRSQLCRTCHIR